VGSGHQFFSLLLIHAGHSHGERGREHKTARFVATETNFRHNLDICVRKSESRIAADVENRILKAGSVTASEESFRVGGVSLPAELAWQCQIDIQQPILAANVAMATPGGGNFGGV
jgi:hypothetical protein